jgi:hypothetical protein
MSPLKKRKKRISVFLAILLITAIAVKVIADYGSLNKLGTNKALGSPLLDDDYNIDKWNSDELAIFGIFLSNYVVPFADDYESAYSAGSGRGSNGYGYQALQFGTGAKEDVLKGMLNFAIQASKNQASLRPLYKDFGDGLESGSGAGTSGMGADGADASKQAQATVKDIFPKIGDKGGISDYMQGMTRLYVDYNDTGLRKKVVLDYNDSYDKQMCLMFLNSALHRSGSGEYQEIYSRSAYTKSVADRPVYLDAFGNIVYQSEDGRLIMLFPACANAHITSNPQYNLLNSVFLGGYYNDATKTDLWNTIAGKGGSASYDSAPLEAVGKRNLFSAGTFMLGYDFAEMQSPMKENGFNFGTGLAEFLKSDINRGSRNYVGLKVQTTATSFVEGFTQKLPWFDNTGVESGDAIFNIVYSDKRGMDARVPTLHKIEVRGGVSTFDILGDPVATSVSTLKPLGNIDAYNAYSVERRSVNFLRKVLVDRPTNLTYISPDVFEGDLKAADSADKAAALMFKPPSAGSMKMSPFFAELVTKEGWAQNGKTSKGKTITEVSMDSLPDAGYKALNNNLGAWDGDVLKRPLILYTKNATLREVNRVFSGDVNAEFAAWIPDIYLTYLEWYGLTDKFGANKLDPALFKEGAFDVDLKEFSRDYLTIEDKRDSIIDSTYLMLDPDKGRDLRRKINSNDFTEIIHEWYTKIVYGGATVDSFKGKSSVTAKRNSAGFLQTDNYYDNPFTAWFVNSYPKFALIILGAGILATFIVGVLGRQKLRWYIISLFFIVNVVILTPVLGDAVPLLSNLCLENAFKDKLRFWGVAESAENVKILEQKDDDGKPLDAQTAEIMRMLNSRYLDRSLMLKYDISRKVTNSELGSLSALQKFKSTRWLLPSIIQQYSAEDSSLNYVYIPLGNALEDARNLYWFYNPADSMAAASEESGGAATGGDTLDGDMAGLCYEGYANTAYAYDDEDDTPASLKVSEPFHQYFYFNPLLQNVPQIDFSGIGTNGGREDIKAQIAANLSASDISFREAAGEMEAQGGRYDGWNPSTVQGIYGYMWLTESPLPYFYMNVKDTFADTSSSGLPFNTPELPVKKEGLTKKGALVCLNLFRQTKTPSTLCNVAYTLQLAGTTRRAAFSETKRLLTTRFTPKTKNRGCSAATGRLKLWSPKT